MKNKFVTVSFFAILACCMVSCQKEIDNEPVGIENQEVVRSVVYSIDGVTSHRTLHGEEAWTEFLDWLFHYVNSGHKVSVRDGNIQTLQNTKEIVHFDTTDEEEAIRWSKLMLEQGYEVIIIYDERTGTYHCTAYN